MASSGSFNTSAYKTNDGTTHYLIFSWEESSQSIANNTTTIKWTIKGYSTGGYVKAQNITLKINNAVVFEHLKDTDGQINLFNGTVVASGTHTISHNADGTKTFTAYLEGGLYAWAPNCSGSKTFTLDTIPRKSSLSVGNGTLGKAQTLSVTRKSNSFTHTITAKCGDASITVCKKSEDTSISFTPPLSWASENPTGTSVSVTYTITTYNGSTSVGSNSYTKTCSIPDSVKPSCSLTVTDAMGYADIYGGYLKGLSKFKVVVSATPAYDSAIASYKTSANGSNYTKSSFTTGVLTGSGTLKVSTTVTDKRGRTAADSESLTVLDYSKPLITALSVHRCNVDGTANDQGEYVKVVFSSSVTALGNKNTATYLLEYKKTSTSAYTSVNLSDYTNKYVVSNAEYIFKADSGSSYNVRLTVEDNFNKHSKATSASTGFTIMHWLASGLGMAIGKIAELTGVLDIGFKTRFYGGILPVLLPAETDLNDVLTPNIYTGENTSTYNYKNCPLTSGTFSLEVVAQGPGNQIRQIISQCHKTAPVSYERTYYTSAWGEWQLKPSMVDSGWIELALGSEFRQYGTGNAVKYRKIGNIVEVRGIVAPVADIEGGVDMHTIATLPSGARPVEALYAICQGSSNCTWLFRVNSSGTLDFSRYRNGDTTATAGAGTWLPFQMTFMV